MTSALSFESKCVVYFDQSLGAAHPKRKKQEICSIIQLKNFVLSFYQNAGGVYFFYEKPINTE